MRTALLLVALFATGVCVSIAVASPGHGDRALTTSSASKPSGDKVELCHRTGSPQHPWIEIWVARPAVAARLAQGDVVWRPGGCPRLPGGATTTTHAEPPATTTSTVSEPPHTGTQPTSTVRK